MDVDVEIKGLEILSQFQSDLSSLKAPPPRFLYSGVGILGSLDDILLVVRNGSYASDFDLQIVCLACCSRREILARAVFSS